MPPSEREKMLADQPYRSSDPELVQARQRARLLTARFNATSPLDPEQRHTILRDLLGGVGAGVWIEPPFHCDYGANTHLGSGVYLNFNCVILDCNRVEVGANCKFGPGVQIYTAYHPLDPTERASGLEMAAPIRIGGKRLDRRRRHHRARHRDRRRYRRRRGQRGDARPAGAGGGGR
jgi:maltose O-acetyltransferase